MFVESRCRKTWLATRLRCFRRRGLQDGFAGTTRRRARLGIQASARWCRTRPAATHHLQRWKPASLPIALHPDSDLVTTWPRPITAWAGHAPGFPGTRHGTARVGLRRRFSFWSFSVPSCHTCFGHALALFVCSHRSRRPRRRSYASLAVVRPSPVTWFERLSITRKDLRAPQACSESLQQPSRLSSQPLPARYISGHSVSQRRQIGRACGTSGGGSCSLGLYLQTLLASTELVGVDRLRLRALPD